MILIDSLSSYPVGLPFLLPSFASFLMPPIYLPVVMGLERLTWSESQCMDQSPRTVPSHFVLASSPHQATCG